MKYLIVIITCLFYISPIMAQDSLLSNKKAQKWCLSFNIDNNYNYRYAKNPIFEYLGNFQKYDKTQAALAYLDTCNIACTMNSFSIKLERKLFKIIWFKSGLIIGRKGYMGCRSETANGISTYRLYYTNIPLPTLTLPLGISIYKTFLKGNFVLAAEVGIELNYSYKRYDNYQLKGYLEDEKKGFLGFKSLKDVNVQVPYEPREQGTVNFKQYYLGFNLKYKLFNVIYLNIEYNYISDFRFYKVREDLHLKIYGYERKSYIHRYGGGIGFMF
jgi:hypothetical protein